MEQLVKGNPEFEPVFWRDSSVEARSYFPVQGLNLATSPPWARGQKQSSLILTLSETKNVTRRQKLQNRYTVCYQRHSTMHGRTHRETAYLCEKQGRDTHPERTVGILNEQCSNQVVYISFIGQPFWVLCLYLANYLVSFSTFNWSQDPPQDACATFYSEGLHRRGLQVHVHTCYGVGPHPFLIPKKPSCARADKEIFLTSGGLNFNLYFQFSSVQSLSCVQLFATP